MQAHSQPSNRSTRWFVACVAFFGLLVVTRVAGNPAGLSVQNGAATAAASGNQLTVTASRNAFLNWQSFNINAGETTTFIQPSASSIVWNRINDQNPSQIFGNLSANGIVVLMNRSGFYFGPDAFVSAAGLVVSTAPVSPVEGGGGLFWQFNGAPPAAGIINYGQLNAGRHGSVFLIAERIDNHGRISAPEGSIGLLSGQDVLISERPDGRGLSAQVTLPSGSVDNSGRLIADAGTIALNARVVNQNGLIQADSIRERNGVIELVAAELVAIGAQSVISAAAGADGVSAGGKIEIKSQGSFADDPSSRIRVNGGAQGGDGGHVEISALTMTEIHSQIDGRAGPGWRGGRLLIDPNNITIGTSGTGNAGPGSVNAGDPPATGALNLNVFSAFLGFSEITLQALNNITISSGTIWDLPASTGMDGTGHVLTLEAGNNITIGNGAGIFGGQNWSISLQAGRYFAASQKFKSGVGNVSLSGTAVIETGAGDINVIAGNNITVNNGAIRTVNGGNISATALGGSINTGNKANGFIFGSSGYSVDPDLGGISTANGGNVALTAGQNIISYLPTVGDIQTDAGAGAFGAAPGNVVVAAGGDVQGHFVVRNGTGSIAAGHDAGSELRPLALSVINGGWTVKAGRDIRLQEVRNPNGIFNRFGLDGTPTKHWFDYAPDAFTVLQAGNSVQLQGSALPRYGDDPFEGKIPPIYPGTLEISAGAGGVILNNDVTLFPSPAGNLKIITVDGGSLVGSRFGELTQIIVSDSPKTHYLDAIDFTIGEHAGTPVHLNDPEPIQVNISGNVSGILFGLPKAAQIRVGGDMINSRFDGQNLRSTDVTSIEVAGDIINRNEFTSIVVEAKPNFVVFDLLYPPLTGSLAGLRDQFYYDQATHTLTFQGRMSGEELATLQTLRVRTFDSHGFPILDANNEPVTAPANFIAAAALGQLYANSQDVPLDPDTGYRLGGGGQFNFTARSLDLGATVGIASLGPDRNPGLATYFTRGADINIHLTGNLDMFSTKIATHNGGAINVFADGDVNVGSRSFVPSGRDARGIFTVYPDDITVVAGGNINVNGSRIAAYDGGKVTVRSLHGNVDAGTGGSGRVRVLRIYVDPITREIFTSRPGIHGNGIYATTFPRSSNARIPASTRRVGDILVEAPEGNITSNAGGVVQNPRNGVDPLAARVTLLAGIQPIYDAAGDIVRYDPVYSSRNAISEQTLERDGLKLSLVDGTGKLVLDADGNPITVLSLSDERGNTTFSSGRSISSLKLSETLASEHSRLRLVYADGGAPADSDGKPIYIVQLADAGNPRFVVGRNIDASGSGVIGGNVRLDATGDIDGLVIARGNSDVSAVQNVNATVLAQGTATVSAGGEVSGTIIGIGSVNASGSSVDAALLSQNVTASGDVSSSQIGFSQGIAASSASQGLQNDVSVKALASAKETTEDDLPKKKGSSGPRLTKTVGRVTVILPVKN